MREHQLPQQHKAATEQEKMKSTYASGGATIELATTTPHQQLHTTIDKILHIAPPDASDVKKGENALPQTEPDPRPTSTNQKDPSSTHKGRAHDKLQRRLPSSTKLETPSPKEAGNGSDMHHHAEQSRATKGDRVPMSRKRQYSSGEPLPGPHPYTTPRLSELLDTCTDATYKDIIRRLPEGWSATNAKGITVTKRQLEMSQWGKHKDDHNVLTFQQTIMLTRQFPNTLTQYDTLLAQSIVDQNDV